MDCRLEKSFRISALGSVLVFVSFSTSTTEPIGAEEGGEGNVRQKKKEIHCKARDTQAPINILVKHYIYV